MASSRLGVSTGLRSAGDRRWSVFVGIALIVLGVFAILLPWVAGIAVNLVLGWVLLFAGAAHLVYAWSVRGAGAVLWQVLLGILYLWVAFYLIVHPARGLLTLTLFLAAYFVFEGILEIITFFQYRRTGRANWFLIDGVITLFLGAFLWAHWPFSSVWAVGTIVGISLLFSGITRLSHRPGTPLTPVTPVMGV